jgi:H+/gluconate symporter-like permease
MWTDIFHSVVGLIVTYPVHAIVVMLALNGITKQLKRR